MLVSFPVFEKFDKASEDAGDKNNCQRQGKDRIAKSGWDQWRLAPKSDKYRNYRRRSNHKKQTFKNKIAAVTIFFPAEIFFKHVPVSRQSGRQNKNVEFKNRQRINAQPQ